MRIMHRKRRDFGEVCPPVFGRRPQNGGLRDTRGGRPETEGWKRACETRQNNNNSGQKRLPLLQMKNNEDR